MLPTAYLLPMAIVLALGGLLTCFAGHRLFRLVLGFFGFLIGAMVTTQFMAPSSSTWALVVAGLVGGLVGSVLMLAAYFLGVGLVGAMLMAIAINVGFSFFQSTPPTIILVVGCVIGALVALSFVRYVVIFGTAIAGSWTFLVGALALAGDEAAMRAASAGDVWILYPLDPQPTRWWLLPAWIALTIAGVVTQLASKGRRKRRRARAAEE